MTEFLIYCFIGFLLLTLLAIGSLFIVISAIVLHWFPETKLARILDLVWGAEEIEIKVGDCLKPKDHGWWRNED